MVSASAPGLAVTTALLQVVPALVLPAMESPVGSVSSRLTPLKAVPEPLVMVTVRRVTSPILTGDLANCLAMVGWVTTLSRAVAAFWLVTPWVLVTPNLAMVLS